MAVTPTLDILGSIGLRPRISFHSPMLQAFRLDCLATKMLISGRWLTQIEHFVFWFLKLWTWCWQVHLSSCKSYSPWFARPLLRPLPFIPLHLAAASVWSTSIGGSCLTRKKNPMGKSHMKFDKKLDQLNKKTGWGCPIFIWEKLVFIYHLVLRGDRQQSRIPTIFHARCSYG